MLVPHHLKPPISGKVYTPYLGYWLLLAITKNTPSSGLSREIFSRIRPKNTPLSRQNGNTHAFKGAYNLVLYYVIDGKTGKASDLPKHTNLMLSNTLVCIHSQKPDIQCAHYIQCVPEKRKPISQVNFSENYNDLSKKVYIVTKLSLSSFFWPQLQDVLITHGRARTISNGDVKIDLRRIGS